MPVIVMAAAANTVGLEQAIKDGAMEYQQRGPILRLPIP